MLQPPVRMSFFSWLFLVPTCSLFLSFCTFVVSGQCFGDQQSLLLQLKKNLVFDSALSAKLVHWNQSADCCSWEGVTCEEGRVIGLDLTKESISGGLDNSSSLFNLQYLKNLSLGYNNFNGPHIPSEFDKLVNLRFLNLSNAGFAGQIPITISRLRRLVILDLSINHFLTTFSLKLENPNLHMLVQNLSELIELHLDGVSISAHGNEWCHVLSSSLPNLRVLSFSNCNLSGPIDSSLVKLKSLSIIRLDGNNLNTRVPGFFADFTNLTSLQLSSSRLYDNVPEKIFQVPKLETLDLSYNLLHGSLPDFPQNGSLRTLVLSNTNFSGKLPDSIGNLKMLSMIDLSVCNFDGSIPYSMESLTQLVHLDMSYNNFNGPIPVFNMAKNLTQINLSYNNLTGQITSTCWEELLNLVNLDLHYNLLQGSIPVSLFSHPSLQKLQLSNNQFSGQLNEFSNISSHLLGTLDLSSNNLEGPIPVSIFELQGIRMLSLSSNKFNGSLQLSVIQQLRNLSNLDLSYNRLWIEHNGIDGINSSMSSFPQITTLKLASSKLKKFPDFLINQSKLSHLDLSDNQIMGEIPNWIWKNCNLLHLNLSHNSLLMRLEGVPLLNFSSLSVLDLHSNQLQGQLPVLPPSVSYLDFSMNDFSFAIPTTIGNSLTSTYFFSLSSNNFNGSIPKSICNASYLRVLDLSNNSLSGTILECLIEMSKILGVLNLGRNNFIGTIVDTFPENCGLQTLDLSGNLLKGMLPKSLASCTKLEILNIGNNYIKDTFPCHLKSISTLHVLVLRSNKFYGSLSCLGHDATWPMLQILDLASNNFCGELPKNSFNTWKAMKVQSKLKNLQFEFLGFGEFYYQDAVTVTSKGLMREEVKIPTFFTSLDFSCNNFDGPIYEEIGELTLLYILNLSRNAFIGRIPQSLGKLSNLESLDLSSNKLTGEIPVQLADGLIFLSVLNLSFNQLVGHIPIIKQFATFQENSYEGNKRLCGFPLKENCTYAEPRLPSPTTKEIHSNFGIVIDLNHLSAGLGFAFGFGIVVVPLVFLKRIIF